MTPTNARLSADELRGYYTDLLRLAEGVKKNADDLLRLARAVAYRFDSDPTFGVYESEEEDACDTIARLRDHLAGIESALRPLALHELDRL